ncbi:Uncharacterised protein [Mycobacteroides abscessus subsp. abscessus]|nr:Uncharacterised protein [Mycobacteroides abscessus subsp. abscessus]
MVRKHNVRGHTRHLASGRAVQVRPHQRGVGGTIGGLGLVGIVAFFLLGQCGPDRGKTDTTHSSRPYAGSAFNPTVPSMTWVQPTAAATLPTRSPRTSIATPAESARPYWDGSWLMNYWEGANDCATGNSSYWVVQPGDNGMDALRVGCFPQSWTTELTNKCRSYGSALPTDVCAVWDPDKIMSRYGQHGNLQIVGLTQACLDRAGLDSFRQGALHKDCVNRPTG